MILGIYRIGTLRHETRATFVAQGLAVFLLLEIGWDVGKSVVKQCEKFLLNPLHCSYN